MQAFHSIDFLTGVVNRDRASQRIKRRPIRRTRFLTVNLIKRDRASFRITADPFGGLLQDVYILREDVNIFQYFKTPLFSAQVSLPYPQNHVGHRFLPNVANLAWSQPPHFCWYWY